MLLQWCQGGPTHVSRRSCTSPDSEPVGGFVLSQGSVWTGWEPAIGSPGACVCVMFSRWVGGVIFARRRPQKNLATRSLGCGRVAWTLAYTRQFFTAGARLPAPWQVPEERKRWRMRFLVVLLCLIFKEIQVRAALLDIQGDPGARPLHVRRFFLAEHQRSLSQFAGLTRWLGRSLSAKLSLLGRWASWRSK